MNSEYEAKRAGREYHNTEYLEDYSLFLCNLSHFFLLFIINNNYKLIKMFKKRGFNT